MPAPKMSSKEKRKALNEYKKVKGVLEIDEVKLPRIEAIPLLGMVTKLVLIGSNAETIQRSIKKEGYELGINKVYNLMRAAKLEIKNRTDKDVDANYAWVQHNLLEMHQRATLEKDHRVRLVVIKELCALWNLNVQQVEVKTTNITPEMLEQFDQQFLR